MATLDDLSPDQRAVLALLLTQGKSYAELAVLLRSEPGAVRQRAVVALTALGRESGAPALPEGRYGALTDWLLGQQDAAEARVTRDHVAGSPAARAWVAALEDELRGLGGERVPELPGPEPAAAATGPGEAAPEPEEDEEDELDFGPEGDEDELEPEPEGDEEARETAAGAFGARPGVAPTAARARGDAPRVSRAGGALLLAGIAIVIVVVLVVLLTGGDDKPGTASTTPATQTATTSTQPTIERQLNLRPPGGAGKALGVANVLAQDDQRALAIQAQDLPANTKKDAYAVWLTGGPQRAVRRLGFAPAVGKDGRLEGVAALPDDADGYDRLEISLETSADPERPGRVILRAAF